MNAQPVFSLSRSGGVPGVRTSVRRPDIAGNGGKPLAPGRAVRAHALQQAACVRVVRLVENLIQRAALHNLSGVHDVHALAQLGNHAQVVRDHDDGGVLLVGDVPQQIQNLRLHRHVQRGGRLVGDDEPRPARQRAGDDDSLAHAAGKLERILAEAFLRARDAHLLHEGNGSVLRFLAAALFVAQDALGELCAHAQHRVQERHRVLENHADPVAADALHLFFIRLGVPGKGRGQGADVLAVKEDLAGGNTAVGGKQAHDGQHADALAGTGFAHHAEQLAVFHGIADVAHCLDDPAARFEFHAQVPDLQ